MSDRQELIGVRIARYYLIFLAICGLPFHSVICILNILGDNPVNRAVGTMGAGLIVIWCIGGGITMHLGRDRFVQWITRYPLNWRIRFVLLCIALAMLEEVVTTSMTNTAPLFGVTSDQAKITISTNYFEVIRSSVVAFIPWFLFWAWCLGRYDFRPAEVMALFGLTGLVAEILYVGSGIAGILGVAFWTYVYGLMIYLPAHTVPERPSLKRRRWWHCIVAVFLPLIFIIPFTIYWLGWLIWRVFRILSSIFRDSSSP